MFNREVYGIDAYADFNRTDGGMTKNAHYGPMVSLHIAAWMPQGEGSVGPRLEAAE